MKMLDKFNLSGKVAVVSGSNQGLGQGMAQGLAEAGCDIVGIDYLPDQLETKAIIEAAGRKFYALQADLIAATVEDLVKIQEEAVAAFGKVDILVNNAGIIRRNDAVDFSEKDWDDVMNINIKNVFFLTQAFGKYFIKNEIKGKVISTASMLSYEGGIRVPSYTASKSAIKGVTMLLSNEWAKYGINVNAVAPGYMATANTAALRDDETRSGQILERIPADRWGTPEDVAGACVFLASPAADYINGFTVAVDGGWQGR